MQIVQRDAAALVLKNRLDAATAASPSGAPIDIANLTDTIAQLESQFSTSSDSASDDGGSATAQDAAKPAEKAGNGVEAKESQKPLAAQVLGWFIDRLPQPWR